MGRSTGRAALTAVQVAALLVTFGGGASWAAPRTVGNSAAPSGPAGHGPWTATEASAAAVTTGRLVLVDAEGDEYEDVVANPDGSFTSTTTAAAHRARVDGAWKPVDPTLEFKADGTVGPKVSATGLAFSGGKPGTPLVTLSSGDKSMSLSWPVQLPKPELDGDAAIYREVFQGVDLRLEASAEGYQYLLVVKSAPDPATDSRLRSIRMGIGGRGVTVHADADHALTAVDDAGNTVFTGPPATSWDSSGTAGQNAAAAVTRTAVATTTTDGPAEGAKVGNVPVQVSDGVLQIDANLGSLGPNPRYPVFVDPSAAVKPSQWNYVSSAFPNQAYSKFKKDAGVGYCYHTSLWACSASGYTNRMYWKFPGSSGWSKRAVTGVVFRANSVFSATCTPSYVDLNQVTASKVTAKTTWNNKPGIGTALASRRVAYGRGKNCSQDSPAAFVEFTSAALTKAVKSTIVKGTELGLGVLADNEKSANSWKRFDGDNAAVSITYDTLPDKPSHLSTTNPATRCVTGPTRPFVRETPDLHALGADADKDNIKLDFTVQDIATNKSVWSASVGKDQQGGDFRAAIPDRVLAHGHSYRWHVQANDGTGNGPVSDSCEFTADLVGPDAAPVVSSDDFPTGKWETVGTAGTFTLDASAVKDPVFGEDIDHFVWSLNNDVPTMPLAVGAGGVATLTISPAAYGINRLWVAAVDRAGAQSAKKPYEFGLLSACPMVEDDTCTAAAYPLDETAGDGAPDTSGHDNPLEVVGGQWVAGTQAADVPADKALHLDPADMVDSDDSSVHTDQSFTVTAWVRPTAVASSFTVVSQRGTQANGFTLGYSATDRRWVFTHDTGDSGTATTVTATSDVAQPAVVGQWVHLAGVYNTDDSSMTLYVNGEFAGRATYSGAWDAQRGIQLGRSLSKDVDPQDKFVNQISGDLDDVRLYQGPLQTSEVRQLWRDSSPS